MEELLYDKDFLDDGVQEGNSAEENAACMAYAKWRDLPDEDRKEYVPLTQELGSNGNFQAIVVHRDDVTMMRNCKCVCYVA